ncbi:class I SAM-dependent methyltransferase [[Clostridium] colinum]|uniref:class I SAM-dependent methyltransferase n=1 Tax=[Clostridium] colinum TaxID=36835 RepID=UPI00202586D0|nr:SAM-dependent methyltransferase [[Clostridium] colinum]
MITKDNILEKLKDFINIDYLTKAIISNPIKKGENLPKKIDIKKITLKNKIYFQFSYYIDKKVIHENIEDSNIILQKIISIMTENFKQCDILANNSLTLLMNKKGNFKITGVKKSTIVDTVPQSHNKTKNYILKDGEFVDWLYKLGIIDKNGIVVSHKQKKFRQINKFLEMIKDIEENLPKNAKIIDMGCGKSYLTFAMYHYFNNIKEKNVTINGYDLKKDVVDHCNNLAKEFGFKNLQFFNEDIQNIDENEKVNMIISLHACDTATDYAIYFGVKLNCDVILSVPCCQHELFKQIKNDTLSCVLGYGILKERFSSILTDSLRAEALKLCGYKTNIIEFIDMEHTPKNIMIKAIKNKNFQKNVKNIEEFEKILYNFGVDPTIYKLLKNYF